MNEFNPVSWDVIEGALGPPAPLVREIVERMDNDLQSSDPYKVVMAVHNELYEADADISGQARVYIATYLLEQNGVISPNESSNEQFRSVADRRPNRDQLYELSWERGRTMWWIAMQCGVHWELVRYWLWEEDIPLKERNFPEMSMEEITAYRNQQSE